MSGLADILIEMGHTVSGSDRQRSALTDYLSQRGARFFEGHDALHVGDIDFVVYSSAIPCNNPEMIAAKQREIPLIRRADLLGQFMLRKLGVAVAGTHGKTTTTSMTGEVLIDAGLDPTVIVGGRMQNTLTNARLGNSDLLVTEADEYDRSFLTLFPRISVLTSLEKDHLDIYENLDDLLNTFTRFANQTSFDGVVIFHNGDENLKTIQKRIERTTLTYGLDESPDCMATDLQFTQGSSSFNVVFRKKALGNIDLAVPGKHNVLNALATITVCMELDIPFERIKQGLQKFRGVERRFECKGEVNDVLFFDDYAHHPSEVRATIEAARNGWNRRLVAVFQPHLYSRTRDFYREFAEELVLADEVILAEIYPAREEPIPGVTSGMIEEEMKVRGFNKVTRVNNLTELAGTITQHIKPGDLVITMGAGDIWQSGEEAVKRYSNEMKS